MCYSLTIKTSFTKFFFQVQNKRPSKLPNQTKLVVVEITQTKLMKVDEIKNFNMLFTLMRNTDI